MENYDEDREEVIERSFAAGVEVVVCIGMLPSGGEEALALAQKYPGRVFASVGCHPYDAANLNDTMLRSMEDLLQEPEMVLVGEMGIDTVKANVPLEIQKRAFAGQLELAKSLDLPICIHSRNAFALCVEVIQNHSPGGWKGFAHCFSDGVEEARSWVKLGFVPSFAGQITFKNKSCAEIRSAAQALGPDAAVVETDSPFLAPTPYRGKRNEPSYIVKTAQKLAELWNISEEEAQARTSATARKVLGIELEKGAGN